jgi:hypothetical protein
MSLPSTGATLSACRPRLALARRQRMGAVKTRARPGGSQYSGGVRWSAFRAAVPARWFLSAMIALLQPLRNEPVAARIGGKIPIPRRGNRLRALHVHAELGRSLDRCILPRRAGAGAGAVRVPERARDTHDLSSKAEFTTLPSSSSSASRIRLAPTAQPWAVPNLSFSRGSRQHDSTPRAGARPAHLHALSTFGRADGSRHSGRARLP